MSCSWLTGIAYSSMAPDPTSDIFKGPCTPILRFVLPIGLIRLNDVRYFCHFMQELVPQATRISFVTIRKLMLHEYEFLQYIPQIFTVVIMF
jgi:hypothetical protein